MGRYSVIDPSTINLTDPNAGNLLNARSSLISAESDFYRGRKNLINSYPMKNKDITTSEVEALYDSKYGNDPWNYTARFNASGSSRKNYYQQTGWYAQDQTFWMQPWPNTPTQAPLSNSYPDTIDESSIFGDSGVYFRFDPDAGAEWIDISIKDGGYTNAFSSKGNSTTIEVDQTNVRAWQGFGKVPTAYNGQGGLSNVEAHMLKLLGDAYDGTVGGALSNYKNLLSSYQSATGSGGSFTFDNSSGNQAWSGYTGSGIKYNRPGTISAKLVKELRGQE